MTGNPGSRRARVPLAAVAGAGVGFALGPALASGVLPFLPDNLVGFGPPWPASRAFLAVWLWSCLAGGLAGTGVAALRAGRPGGRDSERPRTTSRWAAARWAALLLPWLLGAYGPSSGPATYAMVRGWLPVPIYRAVWDLPLLRLRGRGRMSEEHTRYVQWWLDLGFAHELRHR